MLELYNSEMCKNFLWLFFLFRVLKRTLQQENFGIEREVNTWNIGEGMSDMLDNYYMTYADYTTQNYFSLSAAHVHTSNALPEEIDRCFTFKLSYDNRVLGCLTPQKTGGLYRIPHYVHPTAAYYEQVKFWYSRSFTLVAGMQFYPYVTRDFKSFFMVSTQQSGSTTKVNFAQITPDPAASVIGYNSLDSSIVVNGIFLVGEFTRADFVNNTICTNPKLILMNAHKTSIAFSDQPKNNQMLIITPTMTPKARLTLWNYYGISPDYLFDFEVVDGDRFHLTYCNSYSSNTCVPNYALLKVNDGLWSYSDSPFDIPVSPMIIHKVAGVPLRQSSNCTYWPMRMLRVGGAFGYNGDPVLGIFFVDGTDTNKTIIRYKTIKEVNGYPASLAQVDFDGDFSNISHLTPLRSSEYDYFLDKGSAYTFYTSIRVTKKTGSIAYLANINTYRNSTTDYIMIFWSPVYQCDTATHIWPDINNGLAQPQVGKTTRPNMLYICLHKNVILVHTNSQPVQSVAKHPSFEWNSSFTGSYKTIPSKDGVAKTALSTTQNKSIKMTTYKNIFEVIDAKPSTGASAVNIMLASFIDVPINNIVGWNITYQLLSPPMPDVIFTNRVFSLVKFVRNDPPEVIAQIDANEIIYTSIGGVILDHNRRIGFISCRESVDAFINQTTRDCQTITVLEESIGKVYTVYEDYVTNNLYVAAKSNIDNLPYLYIMYIANSTILKVNVTLGTSDVLEVSLSLFSQAISGVTYNVIACMAMSNKTGNYYSLSVFDSVTLVQLTDASPAAPANIKAVTQYNPGGRFMFRSNYLWFMTMSQYPLSSALTIERTYFNISGAGKTFTLARQAEYSEGRPYKTDPKLKACFMENYYLLYQEDVLVTELDYPEFDFYFGATYSASSGKDYFRNQKVRFQELNLYKIKKVFCHYYTSHFVSIYGEKIVELPTKVNKTFTVIATYKIGTDLNSRLLNVYETEKIFTSITETSYHRPTWSYNKYLTIFFDMKQFINSDIYVLKANPFRQKMYFNTTLNGPTNFTFLVKNNFVNKTVNVLFNPTSLPPIIYTQQPKQQYISGSELSIIPGILKDLKGHIIDFYIEGNDGSEIISQRRSIKIEESNFAQVMMSQVGVDTRGTMRRSNGTVFVYSSTRCLLSIIVDNKYNLNFIFKSLTDCSLFNNFKYYAIRRLSPSTTIFYVVVAGQENFYSFAYALIPGVRTTPLNLPTPIQRLIIKYNITPEVETILTTSNVAYFELIPMFFGGADFAHFLVYFEKTESKFRIARFVQYSSTDVYLADVPNLFATNITGIIPNLAVCTLAEHGLNQVANSKNIICISSSYTDRVYVISMRASTSVGYFANFEEIILPSPILVSMKILSCDMPTPSTITCQCNNGNAGSKIVGFTIVKNQSDPNPDCKKDKLCGMITSTTEYIIYPEGLVVDIKSQGDLFYAILDSSSFPQNTNFIMVYNTSSPTVYTAIDLKGGATSDILFESNHKTTAQLMVLNTKNMNYTVHNITEGKVMFNSKKLDDMKGSLVFNNFNQKSIRLDLKSIFSEQYIAPPPPPPPVPPSFLSIYWPFFLIGFAVLLPVVYIIRCLYKRNLALKEQERKKEKVINSLTEFYY